MLSKTVALKKLNHFFAKNRIASMDDLFLLLGTPSRMTVFRRLQEVNYLSSFTHTGRYYTLKSIADFDAHGLWFCNGIGFSRFGNLKQTIRHLVDQSMAGKKHSELENQLKVRVHNPLLELVRLNEISRQSFDKTFLYLNHQGDKADQQVVCRQQKQIGCLDEVLPDSVVIEVLSEIIRSNPLAIDSQQITAQLLKKGIHITPAQCDDLCQRLGLKKTQAS